LPEKREVRSDARLSFLEGDKLSTQVRNKALNKAHYAKMVC